MGSESLRTNTWDSHLTSDWRTMRSPPLDGASNMAIDAALLTGASQRGYGVWRTYAWASPTISFGRNESVRSRFSRESIAAAGLEAVRRPTGGRALLHATEVTYSVTLPIPDDVPWTAAYGAINRVLVTALRTLGAPVELASMRDTPLLRPDGPVCFDQPAPGEIVVDGAKLVGSAVWRERGAYLQHGSILLADSQHQLQAAMFGPHVAPPAAASLGSCLNPVPSWDAVAHALENALRECLVDGHGVGVTPAGVSLDDIELARHESHYRDPAWLWRR
jgi:lipoate-protein ligase A